MRGGNVSNAGGYSAAPSPSPPQPHCQSVREQPQLMSLNWYSPPQHTVTHQILRYGDTHQLGEHCWWLPAPVISCPGSRESSGTPEHWRYFHTENCTSWCLARLEERPKRPIAPGLVQEFVGIFPLFFGMEQFWQQILTWCQGECQETFSWQLLFCLELILNVCVYSGACDGCHHIQHSPCQLQTSSQLLEYLESIYWHSGVSHQTPPTSLLSYWGLMLGLPCTGWPPAPETVAGQDGWCWLSRALQSSLHHFSLTTDCLHLTDSPARPGSLQTAPSQPRHAVTVQPGQPGPVQHSKSSLIVWAGVGWRAQTE